MDTRLDGWTGGLEGKLSVYGWVVNSKMEPHGMGGRATGGLVVAQMNNLSFHLQIACSASLSKIVL